MADEFDMRMLVDPERVEPLKIINQVPVQRDPLIVVDGLRFRTYRRRPEFVTALLFDGTKKMAETIVKVIGVDTQCEASVVMEGTSLETWIVRAWMPGAIGGLPCRGGDYIVIGRDGIPRVEEGEEFEADYQTGEVD